MSKSIVARSQQRVDQPVLRLRLTWPLPELLPLQPSPFNESFHHDGRKRSYVFLTAASIEDLQVAKSLFFMQLPPSLQIPTHRLNS